MWLAHSYLRSDGPLVAAVGIEEWCGGKQDAAGQPQAPRRTSSVSSRTLERRARTAHHAPQGLPRLGSYESIDNGDKFQVKHITVNPGAKLSLRCITSAPSTGSLCRARRV